MKPNLLLGLIAACPLLAIASVPAPYEPATLSILRDARGDTKLCSTPLRLTGYTVQTSRDLTQWHDTGISFGPAGCDYQVAPLGVTNLFFRLAADTNLPLQCLAADATTMQLNWPPIPTATEYQVYRGSLYVGSTAGRAGYYLDRGLAPNTSYSYHVRALDSTGRTLGQSLPQDFSTRGASTIRTRYTVLVVAFYPNGPDNADELSHMRTYLKHRIDFIRLASVNSAVLKPFQGDLICVRAKPPTHPGTHNVDYASLAETPYTELDGYSMVDLVEKGDIDCVWVTKSPNDALFGENCLVGNQDLNPRGVGEQWRPARARCSRSFFVNSYESDARAYDAYAHMAEGVFSTICDGYPSNWPRDQQFTVLSRTRTDFQTTNLLSLHLFERFRLADEWGGVGSYASRGSGNCGTSHFPPNSRRDTDATYDGDYAYYDRKTWQRYIDCAADDWLRYPDFTGTRRKMNGYDYGGFNHYVLGEASYRAGFGASPELHRSFTGGTDSYHLWWFNHLPHNSGVTNGKLNNWWPYVYDFNRFTGDRIDFRVDGFPEPAAPVPVNGEYGTELPTAEMWGYWHSCTDFGPNGEITVVTNHQRSADVRAGQYAVQVEIAQEWFHSNGRNDLIYPISKNARWQLSDLRQVSLSIKPGRNSGWISGPNPIIRLCANGGNRIELVPLKSGNYANFLQDSRFSPTNGWFDFTIPIAGDANWEVNTIGYIDPSLSASEITAAREKLKADILREVNYVEISLRSTGTRGTVFSFYVDALRFTSGK